MTVKATNIRVKTSVINRLYKLRNPKRNSYNAVVTYLLEYYETKGAGKDGKK